MVRRFNVAARSWTRTGQATITGTILTIGILIAAVTIAVVSSNPLLTDMRDSTAVERSIEELNKIDQAIKQVASGGPGASRIINLRPERGAYIVDPDTNQFYYELETPINIVATQFGAELGAATLSANSNISVQETTINGTQCWLMQNDYMEACIRSVPEDFDPNDVTNLTAYWRFNEDEGQFLNDSTENDNNGLLGGSGASESADPSWTSDGAHEDALAFDGNDDYVEISHHNSISFNSSFSIMFWMKGDLCSTGNTYPAPLFKRDNYQFWGRCGSSDFGWRIDDNSGDIRQFGISQTNFDSWTLITGTFDRETNEMKLYKNDELQVTADSSSLETINSSGPLYIGKGNDPAPIDIDEVRIYDTALGQDEVRWLYQQRGDQGYINNSELLVHYRNNELGITNTPDMRVLINQSTDMINGTGWTKPSATGSQLSYGRVRAFINNSRQSYNIYYDLLSGSDFLKLEVTG